MDRTPIAPPAVLRRPGADPQPRWRPGERLHHLFEARCDALRRAGRADHPAIEGDAASLSYAALDARANQLARLLLARGLRPGDRIALLFDKTAHSHVAMLAVLKLHAAYVPLDPGFPADRMAYICADAGVAALLTVQRYQEVGQGLAAQCCCVDTLDAELDRQDPSRPERGELDAAEGGRASELCYVIYTSGSTGRPKGVPIDQAAICNFVRVAAETYGYRESDRVYQGLTLAFDFAVEETWVPLAVGATLRPNQSGGSLLGEDLAEFLQRHRITALCCVPTALATLEAELPALRLLIVSGEACPRDLVQRWARPGRRMLNAYGPTETTVTATLAELEPDAPVTIGRPLPTYAIVILQPDAPVALPFGEVGEIGIAGLGVAAGYLNRPEQTAKAFVPDFMALPDNPSGRLYRTGDLGRVRPDGQVEYLGRIDTQVKIRGYRIELAEIESLLMAQPGIRQAVVQPYEASPGAVELAAYYTCADEAEPPDPQALATALRSQLPPYMLPAWYERLAQMPMLASDKADRRALPPPRGPRSTLAAAAHVAPEGPLEEGIAQTLAPLLGLPQVSATAHFFDELGAHSLLMARLGAQLRVRLGRDDLSMRLCYAHPSVRALAQALAASGSPAGAPPQAAAEGVAVSPPAASTLAHRTAPRGAYLATGAAQLAALLAYLLAQAALLLPGLDWLLAAQGAGQAWGRAAAVGAAVWGLAAGLPLLLKWTLVGRWQAGRFPLWGLRYLRFWLIRQLLRLSPMQLAAGTPLYTLYLRLLGARVAWSAHVGTPLIPVCSDLVRIGEGSVIHRHVRMDGYRAEAGHIELGPVTLGRDCQVGESSLVDLHTEMGDGSRLAHASALLRGQRIAAGVAAQGSPAQAAPIGADGAVTTAEAGERPSAARMAGFTAAQLTLLFGLWLPLPLWLGWLLLGDVGQRVDELFDLHLYARGHAMHWDRLEAALGAGVAAFFAWLAGRSLLALGLARLLARALPTGRALPLYGLHHALLRVVTGLSNSKFHCELMGDSSYVTGYLRALGYRFVGGVVQTGSNFGMNQEHDVPALCRFGRGSMVSDGLIVANTALTAARFRLEAATLGANSFVGNGVLLPAGARVGDDCLLATKVMLPLDGPLRSGVGLLGSPPFEIPRSVQRDRDLDLRRDPALFAQRLRAKDRSNLVTLLLFLGLHGGAAGLGSALLYLAYVALPTHPVAALALGGALAWGLLLGWYILADRCAQGWRPLQPRQGSIYEPAFWRHERLWKLGLSGDSALLRPLQGTPAMGLLWRALGARVGRQLFDDGCAMPEKTLVRLGDHATLGAQSLLQGHSLEDGVFKSDHLRLGDRFSLGAKGFVHYGVVAGDGVRVDPDAFVMKGEQLADGACWRGNPAQAVGARSELAGG
ncbi:MAG: amino acid adenylation domain-containing protein [Burkholderiaceae bacterium]|nr:amino acid adenylation domain-containing protein [Burkholderiaceae bacterium]